MLSRRAYNDNYRGLLPLPLDRLSARYQNVTFTVSVKVLENIPFVNVFCTINDAGV